MSEQCKATALLRHLLSGQIKGSSFDLSPSDWTAFVQLCRTHGLPGLALQTVRDGAPEHVVEALAERQRQARIRGLWLHRSAMDVLRLLQGRGVQRVAPLKGTYLLPVMYEDFGARTTNDVDLLVHPDDFEASHQHLIEAGFSYIPKPEGRPASQRANYERSYQAPEGHIIDLHRGLCQLSRVQLDYSAMWSRAEDIESGDLKGFKRLSDGDILLTLLVHIGQDNFQGPFRQWMDVVMMLTRGRMNLEEVIQRALDSGAGTLMWCVLYRLSRMGVHVPDCSWEALSPKGIRKTYLLRLLNQSSLTPLSYKMNSRRAQALMTLPVMDGWNRRGRFLSEYISIRMRDPIDRFSSSPDRVLRHDSTD